MNRQNLLKLLDLCLKYDVSEVAALLPSPFQVEMNAYERGKWVYFYLQTNGQIPIPVLKILHWNSVDYKQYDAHEGFNPEVQEWCYPIIQDLLTRLSKRQAEEEEEKEKAIRKKLQEESVRRQQVLAHYRSLVMDELGTPDVQQSTRR